MIVSLISAGQKISNSCFNFSSYYNSARLLQHATTTYVCSNLIDDVRVSSPVEGEVRGRISL